MSFAFRCFWKTLFYEKETRNWKKLLISAPHYDIIHFSAGNATAAYRGIAQLVESRSPKPLVVGSSPTAPARRKSRYAICVRGFFFSAIWKIALIMFFSLPFFNEKSRKVFWAKALRDFVFFLSLWTSFQSFLQNFHFFKTSKSVHCRSNAADAAPLPTVHRISCSEFIYAVFTG